MINNECMKNWYLLIVFILFLTSQTAFSAPNYDPNKKPIVYDVSYNIALRKKLEDDFHNKYNVKIDENHYVDTSPMGAYEREVVIPYALNKKRWQDTIITK